jgi:hypothetical protein
LPGRKDWKTGDFFQALAFRIDHERNADFLFRLRLNRNRTAVVRRKLMRELSFKQPFSVTRILTALLRSPFLAGGIRLCFPRINTDRVQRKQAPL